MPLARNDSITPPPCAGDLQRAERLRDARPGLRAADLGGPLHLQRQHAELDVRLDSARRLMEHRPHLEPGLLHAAEAGLDDPAAFYPSAMSSADSVSSLLITTNLPSNFSAALILAASSCGRPRQSGLR